MRRIYRSAFWVPDLIQPVEGVRAWDLAFGRAGNRHPVGCRSRVVRHHPALWTIEYTSLVQAAEGCPATFHVSAGAIVRACTEAIGNFASIRSGVGVSGLARHSLTVTIISWDMSLNCPPALDKAFPMVFVTVGSYPRACRLPGSTAAFPRPFHGTAFRAHRVR